MKNKSEITKGSGNIFADLGLENPEELHARGLLGGLVVKFMKAEKKTQQQLAEKLSIQQSDVSLLMNARFDRFSTDRMLDLLQRLNQKVTFQVSPHHKGEAYHAVSYQPPSESKKNTPKIVAKKSMGVS